MNRAMVLTERAANLMQRFSRLPTAPYLGLLRCRKTIPSSQSHEHHLLKANDLYQMVLHPPVELARDVSNRMGLSPEGAEQKPDVYVRVPAFRESVFRAAVVRDGVPVADILQVWLDVGSHPARGEAQSEEIRHRALARIFEEKR
jgi:hypothetical protein